MPPYHAAVFQDWYRKLNGRVEWAVEEIEGADHLFTDRGRFREVLGKGLEWFRGHLLDGELL